MFVILLLYFLYCNIIIIALFIFKLKTSNNLQQFKYKNDKKLFYRGVKKVKEIKPKIQNRFLCNGSTQRTVPPFIYIT